jgi:hypothetical protein
MSEEFYHDDPIEADVPKRKKSSALAALVLFAVGGFYLQSTFAANLSMNSATTIEFGQGVSQTVACSGNTSLTLTPGSTFINEAGAGTHKLNSIKVENIPTTCRDKDFTFSAYDNTDGSSAQGLFNSISTKAVIHMNNDDTFEVGIGGIGLSVETNSSSSFTLSFDAPVVLAANISKITLQSSLHSPKPCSEGGDCIIGERGPGNGIVFYISATPFTSSRSTCNTNCHYLEVAPAGWNNAGVVANDPDLAPTDDSSHATGGTLAASVSSQSGRTGTEFAAEYENWKIGMGSVNTYYLMTASGSHTGDASAGAYRVWNYSATDSSARQWFIPSINELNELCKYALDQATGNPTVLCNGSGTYKTTANAGSDLGGFQTSYSGRYASSSERDSGSYWTLYFLATDSTLAVSAEAKRYGNYIRPIRAF